MDLNVAWAINERLERLWPEQICPGVRLGTLIFIL